jgi:C-terminal processing protease CtpA/Prc
MMASNYFTRLFAASMLSLLANGTNAAELSTSEKIFGVSTIWLEGWRNFPDRARLAHWDEDYKQALDAASAAPNLKAYYRVLQTFVATLQDGHSFIKLPKGMYMTASRPAVGITRVAGQALVTWVRSDLAPDIPLGSVVMQVDGAPYAEAAVRAEKAVSASTSHVRTDKAYGLAMEGEKDSALTVQIATAENETRSVQLIRGQAWPEQATQLALPTPPQEAVAFKWLIPNRAAYIAVNSFKDNAVYAEFRQQLPALKNAKTIVLDLRKNGGGDDAVGYKILGHFLRKPARGNAATKMVYDPELRANGSNAPATTSGTRTASLPVDIIKPGPRHEHLAAKLVILIGHETVSAAEDFLIAADAVKPVLVGEQTAGSTGQPVRIPLPGGGAAYILSKLDTWPNGKPIVGVGIAPAIELAPTIADVRQGRDGVLDQVQALLLQGKL